MNAEVLKYLRDKFPGVDDSVFYTDYAGDIHDRIIDENAILNEISIEKTCAQCVGNCILSEDVKERNSRVIIKICENQRGKKYQYLDVRRTCGLCCKFDEFRGTFGRLYKNSGLAKDQAGMTFGNYICGDNDDLRIAKKTALIAAKTGECLVIAGKRGTGKTHLAVSIAIETIKKSSQAKFRLVNAMLHELWNAVKNNGGFFDLMEEFKTVPCLVLDDLGKEKNTEAGMDYLHQIVDYRYVNKLQTIITTNALTAKDLSTQDGVDFVAPIISRMLERGKWVTIKNAEDYRVKKGTN